MHFLLVNKNSAVKKIFNITAKKAGIELDVVDSIEKIPLDKDYGCIFVDDEVLKTGNVGDFKSKMITTKFCIILSKDSPLVSGFDSYIRKPFLPTDIYDVLKKEKYNEMNNALDMGDNDENLGEVGEVGSVGDINANSDIDLSEFSDSEDEFLSGTKEADEAQNIDFGGNPMGGSADLNLNDLPSDSISNESPEPSASDSGATNDNSTSEDFEIPTTFDLDSVDLGHLSDSNNSIDDLANPAVNANDSADLGANLGTQNADFDLNTPSNLDASPATDSLDSLPYPASASPTQDTNNAPIDLDSIDLNANPAQDLGIEPDIGIADLAQPQSLKAEQKPQSEILEETESQGNINALADTGGNDNSANAQDDIDFSQIMALQDEILKEEKEKKKKSVIGGDIYTPKGDEVNPAPNDATQTPPEQSTPPALDIAPQTPAPQPTLQADDFADIMPNPADTANPAPALDNIAPDNLTPSPANPADLIDLDLGIDLQNTDSNTDSIDLAQDSVQNITQDSTIDLQTPDIALQDSTPQTPQEISQDAIDLAPSADSIDLAQDLPQGADLSSIDLGTDSQNPMQDAQGAEEDFLESLDFLKDPAPVQSADSADLIDLSSMDSATQDFAPQDSLSIDTNTLDSMPPPAPPPLDLTQDMPPKSAQPEKKPNYEEYSFDSMVDSMPDELFDGLDNLKGISDIADDSLTPQPKHSGNNDILNNLEITPQNLDADYHADLATSGAIADTAQGANPANTDEDANNFNSAFSSGISAEMDSISPNFKAQDFIQDLTLGSDTALPDFSKSLKQHTTPEQRYNMLGLPIDESGDVKNINDLSKNELENLDDEAILLLQEKSLQEPKKPTKPNKEAPKVLDKQQIDDITNILEGTQKPKSTPKQSAQKPQKPSIEISNNEFDSLTQEALSEVLGEEALDFESSADFISAPNNAPSNSNPAPKATNPSVNQSANIDANPPQSVPNIGTEIPTLDEPTLPKQINLSDGSLDIAELLQTFPIDKLRELLSGVQITVNITFPTKKQN